MSNGTARSLEDRLDSTAEAWRPEAGDKIVGTVVDVDSRDGEFGLYPIVTVQTDTGDERAVHAFHTVLKREFAKRQPRPGERIGIKYLGKHERGYEAYRIVWAEVAAAPDWSAIGVEAEAEAAVQGIEPEAGDADDGIPY